MGNQAPCCAAKPDDKTSVEGAELKHNDATIVATDGDGLTKSAQIAPLQIDPVYSFKVTLVKSNGIKLGLDVDFMAERRVLPVMQITGGLAEAWNKSAPVKDRIAKGDCIVEVNGIRDDIASILEACKTNEHLDLTVNRGLNYNALVADLGALIRAKNCAPILIRLSWHDAGVFSAGELTGGCPNAVMRFKGAGEGKFAANAGLPTVAVKLLEPIAQKFVPRLLSHADLWALAANVGIRLMGGPDVAVKFGRVDAVSAEESVESQVGRLPDGDKGADHLRAVFHPKGFDDEAIVCLSGAHTVGKCNLDRSGFSGAWTEQPMKFDNSYFKELLTKSYSLETTSKGCPQHKHAASGTIMLKSDMALIQDPALKAHVQKYADNESQFFNDFAKAWTKMQELGCTGLRDTL